MRRWRGKMNGERFIGNTNTKEVHDLDNEDTSLSGCQIDEIIDAGRDQPYYFFDDVQNDYYNNCKKCMSGSTPLINADSIKGREGTFIPRRVGITTDPETSRAYWKREVVGFSNWRILKQTRSRTMAQEYENQYATKYRCQAYASGPDTQGTWYVYCFDYLRIRSE